MFIFFYFEKGWEEEEGKCSFAVQVKCKGSTTFLKKKNVFKQLFSICEVISYDNIFSFSLLVKHLHSSIFWKYTCDFCWLYSKFALLEENLEGQNEFCAVNNSCLHWQKPNKLDTLYLMSATASITTSNSYFCFNLSFFVR